MKWFKFFIIALAVPLMAGDEKAIFAGGCFWCTEHDFSKTPGVKQVTSGYDGGEKSHPTYEEVSSGSTHYVESVEVLYDPSVISYDQLLDIYWRSVDPTDGGGQFCDRGPQYRPVIFYLNEEQKRAAEASKNRVGKKVQPIFVEILPSTTFYPAEEYHQDYAEKNPIRYNFYRKSCGRDVSLKQIWGEQSCSPKERFDGKKLTLTREEWEKRLTPLQFRILREGGTEPPFDNPYWDNKEKGIYHCAGCDLPLFDSDAKYDSGTGWPSFWEPICPVNVALNRSFNPFASGQEALCARCAGHLGHRFKDGPPPTGDRYCINSAALKFTAQ